MNISEFAEQIVFGKTLEEKLLVPGRLTHDGQVQNRPDVSSLIVPRRPRGLEMRHDPGGTAATPSDDQLENEKARGQLLHFLANHELLATELMALVLLKFPDAPRAFRQGVLVTLQEVQEASRMYIKRWNECGVEFGDYPLSGQFWRIVEPMKSPMDFVSRLSLTFEQANLDYSLHFAKVFDRIGDADTSSLLQKIYEDEIGHVQHGLHWFRQWKDPEQSDWDAYQESLEYPMSPQRGRGPRASFNREGRELAGLTNDFIDAIEVFRQSRGRPPTVRWFDPGAEAGLAGEDNANLVDQLGEDLELVMLPVAKQDDIVLVRKMPSRELRKSLNDVGFELPEFVEFDAIDSIAHRKLHEFEPWAWSPNNLRIAQPLIESVRHCPPKWSNDLDELYRKSWSTRFFEKTIESDSSKTPNQAKKGPNKKGTPDWFCSTDVIGIEIYKPSDVGDALAELNSRGYSTAIFKLDLSASGRGQRRLETGEPLTETDEAWLRSIFTIASKYKTEPNDYQLDSQANGTIVYSGSSTEQAAQTKKPIAIIEPKLDRIVDLSFLWHLRYDGNQGFVSRTATYLGWTRPLIAPGRRYTGTRLSNPFADCDSEVRKFLLTDRGEKLESTGDWLQANLASELKSRNFAGFFGVDAFVYRALSGELAIKPICELNPRMTMGHVALAMQKMVAPGVMAEFRILSKKEWDKVPDSIKQAPVETSKDGRWKSGMIKLSDCKENGKSFKLVPVVLIGKKLAASF